ncbi:MAG TPA: hypothetical protein PKD70_13115 [Saprospiraceae bacterium]|nr:hypothetical protein [Saprospiraceae bacterium]HMP14812.1 hypothetical protein [Saprospiraceae bacterium]
MMKYIITINPVKEHEFLQLLRAWQSLGVVLDFHTDHTSLMMPETDSDAALLKTNQEKSLTELAEEYRDLVD